MNDCLLRAAAVALTVLAGLPAGAQAPAAARSDDIEIPVPKPAKVAEPAAEAEPEDASRDDVYVPGRTRARLELREAAQARPAAPARGHEAAPGATAPATAEPAPVHAPTALRLPPRDGEEQLLAAWQERRHALEMHAYRNAGEIEQRILGLQQELGYLNMFAFATALSHESLQLMRFDPAEALRRAAVATAVAPSLPFAHWTRVRASFNEDPAKIERLATALGGAVRATFVEPRWRAAVLADAAACAFGALLITAVLSLALMLLRHGRYVLHDLRHLLPAGATFWQAGLLGALVLPLPWVFGLGPFGLLAAVLVATWFHLSLSERVVGVLALGLVGVAPWLAGEGARFSSFSGTAAETVYLVEHGGAEGPAVGEALATLADRPNPSFEVLFALGRQARRQGDAQKAVAWLRRAAELRPASPEALVELGNALFLLDDLEGAQDAYLRASQREGGRAAAFFNLARLHAYHAQGDLSREEAAAEVGRGQEYVRRAIEVDAAIGKAAGRDPDLRANLFLAPLPLSAGALAQMARAEARPAAVRDAVGRALMGSLPRPLWRFAALGVGALLAIVALLAGRMLPASGCVKCGRPVCNRCDNEVVGPGLCGQCIHVFRRAQELDPAARAEKEAGIRRHLARRERSIKVISMLVSGSGQILLGRAGRGALQLLVVAWLTLFAVFPTGLMLSPAGHAPVALRAVPALAVALAVHLLAVRRTFAGCRRPLSR